MRYWLVPGCFFLLTGCGSNTKNDDSTRAADSSNESAQAAAEAADNSAAGDSATSRPLAFRMRPQFAITLDENFYFNGCVATLDANLLVGSLSGTVDLTGATCSLGRTVSGTETFAGTVSNGNRTLSITADVNVTLSTGDIVAITSNDPNNPTYSLSASGYAGANANVAIDAYVNEHRTRHTAQGNAVYDMEITTTPSNSPLTIQDQYDANGLLQTRVVVFGTNTVHHVLDKYTAATTFVNVKRTIATCNCPDAGQLLQVITLDADSPLGSGTFTKTYTFQGCGLGDFSIKASTVSGIASTGASANGTFRWDSCF